MGKPWTRESVLEMAGSYRPACVLAAGVDLGVFDALAGGPASASQVAGLCRADPRGLTVLLDALTALELLDKRDDRYALAPGTGDLLTEAGQESVLPMAWHQANCLRRWAQLGYVVRSGEPAERRPSVRGEEADQAAFIGAMHTVSDPNAAEVVAGMQPLQFRHLLDVGGASGTWTIAFLRAVPQAKATLFDLPEVIPLAEKRLTEAGLADRVNLVAGDFYCDALPGGADLAWVSAIAHQNSREQNRQLFGKVHAALSAGGRIAIRDIVMDETRTRPRAGALFAVNMLVATQRGGTYTFGEFAEDLEASGFVQCELVCEDTFMNSVIRAEKA